jgi:hypothetical protein
LENRAHTALRFSRDRDCIPARACTRARARVHALAIAIALLASCGPAFAITLADPAHFAVAATYTPSLPTPYGGLRFSADGNTLYAVGGADDTGSALYSMSVTRDAMSRVVSLGSPVKVFDGAPSFAEPAGLDAGLAFGPSGTLFYTYYPSPNLAQRPLGIGGSENELVLPGITSAAGIAFSPFRTDPGTGFGRLQITTGTGSNVYEVPLTTTATPGLYAIPNGGSLTLFAKLFRSGPQSSAGRARPDFSTFPAGNTAGTFSTRASPMPRSGVSSSIRRRVSQTAGR